MNARDHEPRSERLPFTQDTSEGYTQAEMATLNEEFTRRWNGWDVDDAQRFVYADGHLMSEEDALTQFQREVAQR